MRVEFLLEEPSMAEFLKNLLPRILPPTYKIDENVFLRPHQGKNNLLKSIEKKIKGFSNYHENIKFVILHDQDSNNCVDLKNQIINICAQNTLFFDKDKFLIRIVCKELESWYLGNFDAIEQAYPSKIKASKYKNDSKYRNPDNTKEKPSELMKKLLPKDFQKVKSAREISKFIATEKNTSTSFQVFVSGLRRFLEC